MSRDNVLLDAGDKALVSVEVACPSEHRPGPEQAEESFGGRLSARISLVLGLQE